MTDTLSVTDITRARVAALQMFNKAPAPAFTLTNWERIERAAVLLTRVHGISAGWEAVRDEMLAALEPAEARIVSERFTAAE